jgi:crotonobetainyl-CoA:carnitine CoA-transferase CaiB-like acyl-CoA transferase
MAWLTGRDGQVPQPGGAAIVDQHGAALLAMGTLAALLHRQRNGEGQHVEVVMAQAALDLFTEPYVYHLNGAPLQRPASWVTDTFHEAPYGIYPTADGAVAVSMASVADVRRALGDAAELAPYSDPAIAFERRDEISAALGEVLIRLTTSEIVDRLRAQNLWCAPVHDVQAAFADPAIRYLDPVLEFDHPVAGKVRVLKHPVRYGAGPPELRYLPPQVGEHTDQVLEELGYSSAEVAALRSSGAIS